MSPKPRGRGERRKLVEQKKGNDARQPHDVSNRQTSELVRQKKDTQKVRQQSGEEPGALKATDEHGTQDASLKERTRQHGGHEPLKQHLDKVPEQNAIGRSE